MAVLLLALMELQGASAYWLHVFGTALIILRLLHPVVLFENPDAPMWKKAGRFIAAAGTALLLVIGSAVLLLG